MKEIKRIASKEVKPALPAHKSKDSVFKQKSAENDIYKIEDKSNITDSTKKAQNDELEDSYEDQFEVISRASESERNSKEFETQKMNRNEDVRQTFNPQIFINENFSIDDETK